MKRWHYLLLLFVFATSSLHAEKHTIEEQIQPAEQPPVPALRSSYTIIREFNEALKKASESFYERIGRIGSVITARSYVDMDPFMYPMFMPFTYYSSMVNRKLDVYWTSDLLHPHKVATDTLFKTNMPQLEASFASQKAMCNTMLAMYMQHPELVKYTEIQVLKNTYFEEEKAANVAKPDEEIIDVFTRRVYRDPKQQKEVGQLDYEAKRPNFWKIRGSASLQFTQNYISGNWYKGGESTNSMLSNLVYEANYNDEQKVQFDNKLEIKLGLITAPSDTVHGYRTNTDLFRITSKLGFRAVNKWYYTVQADMTTQFCSSFKKNTNTKESAFLTPLDFNLGLGMDYKKQTDKLELSVFMSPISYHLRYVGDASVDETRFGLDKGETTMNELGCKVQITSKWQLMPRIVWQTRFYYFSNYKKVESEWENTFNFIINDYLSTKLFMHGRFYDAGAKKGNSYFQLKEILSFGLNYTW